MKYDITAKRIVDIGKEQILKEFFGIESDNIQLLENCQKKLPVSEEAIFH